MMTDKYTWLLLHYFNLPFFPTTFYITFLKNDIDTITEFSHIKFISLTRLTNVCPRVKIEIAPQNDDLVTDALGVLQV